MSELRIFDYWVDRLSGQAGSNKSLAECVENLALGESSNDHGSSSSSPSSFDDILDSFSGRLLKHGNQDITGSDEGRLSIDSVLICQKA